MSFSLKISSSSSFRCLLRSDWDLFYDPKAVKLFTKKNIANNGI